jgi:predicted RND superfamily exporter protein
MLTSLYQRHGRWLLVLAAIAFPFVYWQAESMPSNNDLETWLPKESEVRSTYDMFKEEFGAEEVILVGLPHLNTDDPLVESVAERLSQLPGIRHCWSPRRFSQVMRDLTVSEEKIEERITGLSLAKDKKMLGLVAMLSESGLRDRAGTVRDVEQVLDYCQLRGDDVLLTGGPVVVAELDRLGGTKNNKAFFVFTLMICSGLLYYFIREVRLTAGVMLITVFSIELTNSIVKWSGGEMNFILGAMPIMVMIFTLSIAVHFISYYRESVNVPDRLIYSIKHTWKPVFLSALMTVIGFGSLVTTSIGPVWWFGYAGAIGSIVSFLCGLGLTPALLIQWPEVLEEQAATSKYSHLRIAHWIIRQRWLVTAVCIIVVASGSYGLGYLTCRIDPLDFLPKGSDVVKDLNTLEEKLTSIDSVEAILDFRTSDAPFMEKLERVRQIEARLGTHPSVTHTMSIASFFPEELPEGMMGAANFFNKALGNQHRSDFLSAGERYWRVSCRIRREDVASQGNTFSELKALVADAPEVTLTGIKPLIEQAQMTIFQGFKESFSSSFILIAIVSLFALRSVKLAVLGLIPNISPIMFVFGLIGWCGVSVDIGMMMTGSIAFGMSVDATFHLLFAYQDARKAGHSSQTSAFHSLAHTGKPIFEAAAIASTGMLALTLSSFTPTVRFGLLMAVLLWSAVVGCLVQLPAILAIIPGKRLRQADTVALPKADKAEASPAVEEQIRQVA